MATAHQKNEDKGFIKQEGGSNGSLQRRSTQPPRGDEKHTATTTFSNSSSRHDANGAGSQPAAASSAANGALDRGSSGSNPLTRLFTSRVDNSNGDGKKADKDNKPSPLKKKKTSPLGSKVSNNSHGSSAGDDPHSAVSNNVGTGSPPDANAAPGGGEEWLSPDEKGHEQQTLREQLQKLVSHKLSTLGDLDHAGMVALEALSKMPPLPGAAVSGQSGAQPAAGKPGRSRQRRVLPPGLDSVPKFCGKNPFALTDTLNRFSALVISALPGSPPDSVNRALLRDVVFVLEGSALKFYNALKDGQIEWEPAPPPASPQKAAVAGGPLFKPPSTWAQVCEALHDHYLPADGIARTSEALLSLRQLPAESVPNLAGRQLGLSHHLNRLIDSHNGRTTFWEAMSIGLFERALRPDLRRAQQAEPPCSTFQESVDRADRNAAVAASPQNMGNNNMGGGSACSDEGAGAGLKGEQQQQAAHFSSPDAAARPQQQQQSQSSMPCSARIGNSDAVATAGDNVAGDRVADVIGGTHHSGDGVVTVKCEMPAAERAVDPEEKKYVGVGGDGGGPSGTNNNIAHMSNSGIENNGGQDSYMGTKQNTNHTREGYGKDYHHQTARATIIDSSQPGGSAGSPLRNEGAAVNLHGGGGDSMPQPNMIQKNIPRGAKKVLFPDYDDDEVFPGPPRTRREGAGAAGGRGGGGGGGGMKEERGRSCARRMKPAKKPPPPSKKQQRRAEWHEANNAGGGAHPSRPRQRPRLDDSAADRPPCTLPQCKSINRQFHCANDCFYHFENGERNRALYDSRWGGKKTAPKQQQQQRRPEEPMEYDGYNYGYPGPPFEDGGFPGPHFY